VSAGGNIAVSPFSNAESASNAANGIWAIEVRSAADIPGPVWSRSIYIHDSLHTAMRCPDLAATDADILSAAKAMFESASSGSTSAVIDGARVRNPFVNFNFKPPAYGTYSVNSGGDVEYLSLRRHFTLSSDETVVMMRRHYEGRRAAGSGFAGQCFATTTHVHRDYGPGTTRRQAKCDAIAMNFQGFGLCLDVNSAGTVSKVYGNQPGIEPGGFAQLGAAYFSGVDHFLWSKLYGLNHLNQTRYFSPKCEVSGSCSSLELFIPHRSIISP
jgi:hypothetical protein